MAEQRAYEYARLWLPVFAASNFPSMRAVYLIEDAEGFEGHVAEKGLTFIAIMNGLGRDGWRSGSTPQRYDPGDEFQLLVDATLDEAGEPPQTVIGFDVFMMRRRARGPDRGAR
jgi:hypothetical protein